MAQLRMTTVAALLAGMLSPLVPGTLAAEVMAIGIDRKFTFDEMGKRQALEPGHDEVVFFDLKDPAKPEMIGSVALENSIVGPPTNLAITPDQKLALIANALHSVRMADDKGWTFAPADELYVVDLNARPPKLLKTLRVGLQPSGIAIDKAGHLALVANREGKSISVLAIDGTDVSVKETVSMTDSVVSVALAPDGRRAYAAKFQAHKVAVMSIDEAGHANYEGRDLPVGPYPWTITVTPDGAHALVTNIGFNAASDGNAKSVSIVDLKATPERVVQHVTVGDAPEGIAVSPDGKLAAATILQGSFDAPRTAWWAHPAGLLSLLRIEGASVRATYDIPVEAFPEGVAFSADSRTIYVGNFASSTLSVLSVDRQGKVASRSVIKLPGPPASLRIGSR